MVLFRCFNKLLLLVGLFAVALLHFVGELTVLSTILSEHLARTASLLGAFLLLMQIAP